MPIEEVARGQYKTVLIIFPLSLETITITLDVVKCGYTGEWTGKDSVIFGAWLASLRNTENEANLLHPFGIQKLLSFRGALSLDPAGAPSPYPARSLCSNTQDKEMSIEHPHHAYSPPMNCGYIEEIISHDESTTISTPEFFIFRESCIQTH